MATKRGGKAAGSAAKRVAATKAKGRRAQGRVIDAAESKLPRRAGGGRKPGMCAAEKALRDSAVVARVAQGWTHKRVAEHFGMGERTVRDVLASRRAAPSGMDTAPMQLVEDLLRQLSAMVGDFEDLALAYAKDHPGVATAAKRQARETVAEVVALQRMLGLLPTNLGLFRAEADLRHLGNTVLDRLADFEAGKIDAEEVARLVREEIMQEALRDLPAARS